MLRDYVKKTSKRNKSFSGGWSFASIAADCRGIIVIVLVVVAVTVVAVSSAVAGSKEVVLTKDEESFVEDASLGEVSSDVDSFNNASQADNSEGDAYGALSDGGAPDVLILEEVTPENLIGIHVAGAVNLPGVHFVPEGSRVADAVEAAGGFCDDAVPDAINLARLIIDGEQVFVPSAEDVAEGNYPDAGSSVASYVTSKININNASVAQLQELPGIGPSLAQGIVDDRSLNGPFVSPEDLLRVSGIGEKKYERIADLICV